MPKPEQIMQVVNEWVKKAEDDLKAACHLLTMGEECPG